MRLFLIRHADPDYPNNTITPAGHLEARALALRLQKLGLDRIYCSPLGRAIDTARYTADALGLTPTIMPWLAELAWARIDQETLGPSTIWDVHGHTVHTHDRSRLYTEWHTLPPFDHPDYTSGLDHIRKESDIFLESLGYRRKEAIYEIQKSNREKIAIFCHGGFGLTWLSHLLNIPTPLVWAGFFLPPSSVTTILFDERTPAIAVPRCLGVGDISHLYAAGLPMQPSGIKANLE